MNKRSLVSMVQNCKNNIWLLFSAIAALCLFFSPSLISFVFSAVVFCGVVMAVAFDIAKPTNSQIRIVRWSCLVLTILILYLGFNTFNTVWAPSSKVAALSSALGVSTPIFLLVASSIGCIGGAHAIYVLAYWIILWSAKLMRDRLPVQEKTSIIRNLKQNWYFPISAMAFFCLSATLTLGYLIGLLLAFVIAIIISTQISSILGQAKNSNIAFKALSIACYLQLISCLRKC